MASLSDNTLIQNIFRRPIKACIIGYELETFLKLIFFFNSWSGIVLGSVSISYRCPWPKKQNKTKQKQKNKTKQKTKQNKNKSKTNKQKNKNNNNNKKQKQKQTKQKQNKTKQNKTKQNKNKNKKTGNAYARERWKTLSVGVWILLEFMTVTGVNINKKPNNWKCLYFDLH